MLNFKKNEMENKDNLMRARNEIKNEIKVDMEFGKVVLESTEVELQAIR